MHPTRDDESRYNHGVGMKYIISLLAVFFSGVAFSECGGVSCTDVIITRLYVIANGDTIISTSGDESKLSCDAGSFGYITLEKEGNRNYNSTYALLLTSHTTGYPIWVRASEAGACKIIYIVSDK